MKFEKFTDQAGNLLAWMWYGISRFEKQIPAINPMRGIRLRKGNIQIGNENTFASHEFYDEPRGGLYFVGEVFAVSADLIPNARRDYFNLNATCRSFERELRPLFHDKFKRIYHYANDYKKALQKQQDLIASQEEYQHKVEIGGFLDAEDKQKAEDAIKEKQKIAEKAAKQKGKVGKGHDFFCKAFGKDEAEYFKILYMPEAMIIYRFYFEGIGLTEKWWQAYSNLTDEEKALINPIIEHNDFRQIEKKTSNPRILAVLKYYTITREEAEKDLSTQ